MKRWVAMGLFAFGLVGCNQEVTEAEKLEKKSSSVSISLVSPDAAVKSWWSLVDEEERLSYEACKTNKDSNLSRARGEVLRGKILSVMTESGSCFLSVTEREIKQVDVQSDTRAIVVIHMVNKTEPSVELSKAELQVREKGREFHYLVERDTPTGDWKISQIYYLSEYSKKWEPMYVKPLERRETEVHGF